MEIFLVQLILSSVKLREGYAKISFARIEPIISLGYTKLKKFEQASPNRRFFILFDKFKPRLIDYNDNFPSDNQLRKFHVHVFENNRL
jgi:hypothetical protein